MQRRVKVDFAGDLPDEIWPKATEAIKIVRAEFNKLFAPRLTGMGFKRKGNNFYRSNGCTYQAIGFGCNNYYAWISVCILPYWSNRIIDIMERVTLSGNHMAGRVSHEMSRTIMRTEDGVTGNFLRCCPLHEHLSVTIKDLPDFVRIAYADYDKVYFDLFDKIKDEQGYLEQAGSIKPLLRLTRGFVFPDQKIVLYEASKKNSIDYLRKMYQEYYLSKHDYFIKLSLGLNPAKDPAKSEEEFIEYLDKFAGDIQQTLISGDFSSIRELHDREAEEMRKYFYDGLKMTFEDV